MKLLKALLIKMESLSEIMKRLGSNYATTVMLALILLFLSTSLTACANNAKTSIKPPTLKIPEYALIKYQVKDISNGMTWGELIVIMSSDAVTVGKSNIDKSVISKVNDSL